MMYLSTLKQGSWQFAPFSKRLIFFPALLLVVAVLLLSPMQGKAQLCPGDRSYYSGCFESLKNMWAVTGGIKIEGGQMTDNYVIVEWTTPGWGSIYHEDLDANTSYGSCTYPIYVGGNVNGGSVSPSYQEICMDETTSITLSESEGNIQRWEKSTDGGSTWEHISFTGVTYTTSPLTQDTQFRVLLESCSNSAYSPVATVEVWERNRGYIGGGGQFCPGTVATGVIGVHDFTGTVMGFQKSEYLGEGNWTAWEHAQESQGHDINEINYSVTGPTRYRAEMMDRCGFFYSDVAEVLFLPPPPAQTGYISGPSQVCSGANFSLAINNLMGNVVAWYKRDFANGELLHDWADIGGPPTNISIVRNSEFKARIQRTDQCAVNYDEIHFAVDLFVPPAFGTLSSSREGVCPGAVYNLTLTGFTGQSVTWQSRPPGNNESWTTTATGTSHTREVNNAQASLVWRALQVHDCGEMPTNTVEIEVFTNPAPITSNAVACAGDDVVLAVNNPQPPPVRYHWYTLANGQFEEKHVSSSNEYTIIGIIENSTVYVAFEKHGCTGSKAPIGISVFNMNVPAAPYSTVTVNPLYQVSLRHDNVSSAGVTYYWQTESNGKSQVNSAGMISMPAPGLYYIKAKNTNGCWSDASNPVEVINHEPTQYNYPAGAANYVRTYTFQERSTTTPYPQDLDTESSAGKLNVTTTYVDGLGRPLQQVIKKGSATELDVVIPIEYDGAGRKLREYLPYASADGSGNLKTNPLQDQRNFYGVSDKTAESYFPFSYQQIERSPLDRPQASFAPGNDWAGLAGSPESRRIEHHYQSNTSADSVWLWQVDAQALPFTNASYAPGSLFLNETIDEHGFRVREFKTKENKLVLKRVQVTADTWADTYYIYDDFGNLVAVLPPEAVKKMKAIINQN